MLSKKVISIDEELCIACGLCCQACQEGAIELVEGKAKLVKENHCDGLGNCLPECPVGALQLIERKIEGVKKEKTMACGCSSHLAEKFSSNKNSELVQWPVQLKLVAIEADYFNQANLLIAADCTAYAYKDFHENFMKDKISLIACPKLDNEDYSLKLAEIFKANEIKSISLVKMQVPCCNGLLAMVERAIELSGKNIPLKLTTISTKGELI